LFDQELKNHLCDTINVHLIKDQETLTVGLIMSSILGQIDITDGPVGVSLSSFSSNINESISIPITGKLVDFDADTIKLTCSSQFLILMAQYVIDFNAWNNPRTIEQFFCPQDVLIKRSFITTVTYNSRRTQGPP
jgi:hypothetical protein